MFSLVTNSLLTLFTISHTFCADFPFRWSSMKSENKPSLDMTLKTNSMPFILFQFSNMKVFFKLPGLPLAASQFVILSECACNSRTCFMENLSGENVRTGTVQEVAERPWQCDDKSRTCDNEMSIHAAQVKSTVASQLITQTKPLLSFDNSNIKPIFRGTMTIRNAHKYLEGVPKAC